ncbi:MAG: UDP-N-acetylmuramoyl-L-alanine--D-glutamate ligase [Actinomycetota bacterium]
MSAFSGERIVVVGAGVAGRAAAAVLARNGAEVRVTDASSVTESDELRALGVRIDDGGHDPAHLDGATAVVPSPGVPEHAEILRWAAERGIPVWSELDVGARLCRVRYVAITGTNGKSTTTEMVASMMRASGLDAIACGNIGHPFSVAATEPHEALAVEASSFQLRFHHWLRPSVSALLNVAEDHTDWHGSFASYAAAKARIFELQGADDVHVGNADDPLAARISHDAPCRAVWFRSTAPREGEVGLVRGEVVARLDGEESLGRPALDSAGFRVDAAAAAAIALSFGVEAAAIRDGLARMVPLAHRGEEVARVGDVAFLDDSKATNVHAALNALAGRTNVVLIAGGLAKGADLAPLLEGLPSLAALVAIGDAAPALEELFADHIAVRRSDSIEEAVRVAHELAAPASTVLLAPACASWDMFRDYTERGDRFAAAARALSEEVERAAS